MAEENGKLAFQLSGKVSIKEVIRDVLLALSLLGAGTGQYNHWSVQQQLARCEKRVEQLERRLSDFLPSHKSSPEDEETARKLRRR